MIYYGGNLYIFKVVREKVNNGGLNIYNVYNPLSDKDRQRPLIVPLLKRVLAGPGEYILLNDFNLYYKI